MSYEKALEKAAELGREAGLNAGGWYEQDLWGVRATKGEKDSARSVVGQAFLVLILTALIFNS
jgi:hypothetical protein